MHVGVCGCNNVCLSVYVCLCIRGVYACVCGCARVCGGVHACMRVCANMRI